MGFERMLPAMMVKSDEDRGRLLMFCTIYATWPLFTGTAEKMEDVCLRACLKIPIKAS
jgi:hypothetical protein